MGRLKSDQEVHMICRPTDAQGGAIKSTHRPAKVFVQPLPPFRRNHRFTFLGRKKVPVVSLAEARSTTGYTLPSLRLDEGPRRS